MKTHAPSVETEEPLEDIKSQDHTQPVPVALTLRSHGTLLKEYTTQDLEIETFDLIAKVKELLNTHNLWGPDGTYTFEDGERWAKLEGEDDETIGS